ncbi:uncharacterized protein MONBRDRAFT_7282 [Monosiga brevicollis MX1]|uniref:Uncharacterized protein n=1 Tax=Monosiga brevicollis TaxID=81824 RepID=A9UWH4_MONBE|nr:uncharacterized protein MONBRDRAFT_7282 [Monosiga brevicollis MX1]EDQ90213.1 predicted protein [Monosiga brevicollis MX1]|eukprot:XP_001744980.1 hypothetical protein [Monosiga brevicollis MX1]
MRCYAVVEDTSEIVFFSCNPEYEEVIKEFSRQQDSHYDGEEINVGMLSIYFLPFIQNSVRQIFTSQPHFTPSPCSCIRASMHLLFPLFFTLTVQELMRAESSLGIRGFETAEGHNVVIVKVVCLGLSPAYHSLLGKCLRIFHECTHMHICQHDDYHYIGMTDEIDLQLLRRQLVLLRRFLQLQFGSFLGMICAGDAAERRENWRRVDHFLQTALKLRLTHQAFLVECIEPISGIRTADEFRSIFEKHFAKSDKGWGNHGVLLSGTKLVQRYTRPDVEPLQGQDLLMLITYAQVVSQPMSTSSSIGGQGDKLPESDGMSLEPPKGLSAQEAWSQEEPVYLHCSDGSFSPFVMEREPDFCRLKPLAAQREALIKSEVPVAGDPPNWQLRCPNGRLKDLEEMDVRYDIIVRALQSANAQAAPTPVVQIADATAIIVPSSQKPAVTVCLQALETKQLNLIEHNASRIRTQLQQSLGQITQTNRKPSVSELKTVQKMREEMAKVMPTYVAYLRIKTMYNVTITTLRQYAGLVHYWYIDRSRNVLLCRSLDSRSTGQELGTLPCVERDESKGYTTLSMTQGSLRFTYFLWFESQAGARCVAVG